MSDNINTAEKKENKALVISVLFVVLGVIVMAIIGFLFLNEPPEIIEGQAEATSVKISGKLPGRVVDIYVTEGQKVSKGDTLIHIHSAVAEAQLLRAQAMETAAAAQNRKIDAGTREQIVASARQLLAQATAARQLAEKTYNRMENLYKESVISEQKRDEAKAAYEAAVAGEKAAESQLSLAVSGAQREDKQSALAMVDVAKGGVDEVNALLQDQYLTAPADGEIDRIYPEPSELVSLGAPLMSLLRTDDKWVVFNVREELLNEMKVGTKIKLMIPALDRKEVEAEIFYVRDMGNYATWRATKAVGDWDSRTFEVKARPTEKLDDLRPGMTVIYKK
ncbi:MAG: efflux RND transporter periplasmic adaptor subunit [Paramuribaculum sp.]|nr:efflux RND transporter periplasmic adaptor subunit [Paramuribaculum sp.]